MNTWYDEKYKFYHCASYCDLFELPNSNWSNHTFVSLNSDGKILGCVGYSIVRDSDAVDGIGAINFSKNKIEFGKDLIQVIRDIFEKFNYRKLSFSVIVGNPIERSYDRMTLKYGGRIVGTNKEHIKLMDGKYYDQKFYEIMREDYMQGPRRTEAKKMRLIDADALMEIIRQHDYPLTAHINSKANGMFTSGIQQAIDETPTVNPVHAAGGCYCQECKWFGTSYAGKGWCNEVMARPMPQEGFCNYGIRREGDNND